MAWHILHSLLEQVRIHSTFPGKLWILTTFIFRIVVVARIGDNVYHDEQSAFHCNTLTPGCENVCFNRFSPISQLRFWSLLVLVVSSPSVLFFLYASHKIYHAHAKHPSEEAEAEAEPVEDFAETALCVADCQLSDPKRNGKYKSRYTVPNATAPPLYTMERLDSEKYRKFHSQNLFEMEEKWFKETNNKAEGAYMENQETHLTINDFTELKEDNNQPYPIYYKLPNGHVNYTGQSGERISTPKSTKPPIRKENKDTTRLLKNPQIYRAYWWHVVVRLALEGGFIYGQYLLYGLSVPELYECNVWACTKETDCFISRPMEKTCLLWLMYGLGILSCVLSLLEFYALGWKRLEYAFCCGGRKLGHDEKRKILAAYAYDRNPSMAPQHHHAAVVQAPADNQITKRHGGTRFTRSLSLESLSSETTVESV